MVLISQTYFNDYVRKCVLYVIINENCIAYDPAVESDNEKNSRGKKSHGTDA